MNRKEGFGCYMKENLNCTCKGKNDPGLLVMFETNHLHPRSFDFCFPGLKTYFTKWYLDGSDLQKVFGRRVKGGMGPLQRPVITTKFL